MRHWKSIALAAVVTALLALPMQSADATGCKKKKRKPRCKPVPECVFRVPDGIVDVCVEVGDTAYLIHSLSNAGDLNGLYEAWCVDVTGGISVDCYGVELVSSLDADKNGVIGAPENWDLINYFLNELPAYRANGATKYDIQWIFWRLADPGNTPSELPDDQGLAEDILADVRANGSGFVPAAGQLAAVAILHADPSLQETIIGVKVTCTPEKPKCKPCKPCVRKCKSDKSDKSCKSDKSGKSDKSSKCKKRKKRCKSDKSDKSCKSDKSGKSDKSSKCKKKTPRKKYCKAKVKKYRKYLKHLKYLFFKRCR